MFNAGPIRSRRPVAAALSSPTPESFQSAAPPNGCRSVASRHEAPFVAASFFSAATISWPLTPAGPPTGDQHEVVVHHGNRLIPKPSATNFSSLAWSCTNGCRHRRAAPCRVHVRFPGDQPSHRPAGGLECRQQLLEQTGLLGRRGGGHHDTRLRDRIHRRQQAAHRRTSFATTHDARAAR